MSKKVKNNKSKTKQLKKDRLKIPRRDYYEHEKKYPWLKILLDCYAISDHGMSEEIVNEEKRRDQKVACHKGCYECCLNPDVPITELEIRGISWYVSEILNLEMIDKIIPKLLNHANTTECPFLIDKICSIYPVRPLACREFIVYNTPCSAEESVFFDRPEDMHPSNPKRGMRVAMRFFDCDIFNLSTRAQKEIAFREGIMLEVTRPMHELNWSKLIEIINAMVKIRFNA